MFRFPAGQTEMGKDLGNHGGIFDACPETLCSRSNLLRSVEGRTAGRTSLWTRQCEEVFVRAHCSPLSFMERFDDGVSGGRHRGDIQQPSPTFGQLALPATLAGVARARI